MKLRHEIQIDGEAWQVGELGPADVRTILFEQELVAKSAPDDAIKYNILNRFLEDEDGIYAELLCHITGRTIDEVSALSDSDLDLLIEKTRVLNRRFLATEKRLIEIGEKAIQMQLQNGSESPEPS